MSLASQISDFLKYLKVEQGASELTIRNYDHYLTKFLEFSGEVSPKDIDLALVKKYQLYLSQQSLKKVTQNFFLIGLRTFLRFLARQGINTLPAEKVELNERDSRSVELLDGETLKDLLTAPDTSKLGGLRDRAILETLFSTGLRVSELASLNRDHIDLNSGEFAIVGKGGKERTVFLSDSAIEWLSRYLNIRKDTFKPLFIRFQGRVDLGSSGEAMRLTPRSIERAVEKYGKATPQSLRYSSASELLKKGADIRLIQKTLGHDHIASTRTYAKLFS